MINRLIHWFSVKKSMTRLIIFALMAALYPFAETKGQVLINEVSSANFTGLADEDGDYEDWIELYNAGNFPVNLKDWVLTDNPDRPKSGGFPRYSSNQMATCWCLLREKTGSTLLPATKQPFSTPTPSAM
jgi:hypothetical protein